LASDELENMIKKYDAMDPDGLDNSGKAGHPNFLAIAIAAWKRLRGL